MKPVVCFLCSLAVAFVVSFSGCGSDDDEYQEYSEAGKAEPRDDHHDHHAHSAPHGGQLVELGDHKYNLEFVFDAEGRKLTAYVLDAHAEKAVAIEEAEISFHLESGDEETMVTLQAAPQEGDAEGKSSRFEATGDALPASVKTNKDLKGHVHVTVAGEEFTGDIEDEHDHDHDHDHEHGKK